MSPEVSERSLEEAIESTLLRDGPDAPPSNTTVARETRPPFGDTPPGLPAEAFANTGLATSRRLSATASVSCQRSPEPVFLKWKGLEASPGGDFFVRSGPGTVKLPVESATEYVRTRFPAFGGPAATPVTP